MSNLVKGIIRLSLAGAMGIGVGCLSEQAKTIGGKIAVDGLGLGVTGVICSLLAHKGPLTFK